MKQAVPWYFPSKIIWLYVPNWRCTSRILIWGNDIRISCFPLVPLGFFTNMNLFNKESVIFLAVRNASATFRYISHYRWNRPCHGDFSSLMWLSTTWCDLSISPLWHGDDVTFPAWCDLSTVLVLYCMYMSRFLQYSRQWESRFLTIFFDKWLMHFVALLWNLWRMLWHNVTLWCDKWHVCKLRW